MFEELKRTLQRDPRSSRDERAIYCNTKGRVFLERLMRAGERRSIKRREEDYGKEHLFGYLVPMRGLFVKVCPALDFIDVPFFRVFPETAGVLPGVGRVMEDLWWMDDKESLLRRFMNFWPNEFDSDYDWEMAGGRISLAS